MRSDSLTHTLAQSESIGKKNREFWEDRACFAGLLTSATSNWVEFAGHSACSPQSQNPTFLSFPPHTVADRDPPIVELGRFAVRGIDNGLGPTRQPILLHLLTMSPHRVRLRARELRRWPHKGNDYRRNPPSPAPHRQNLRLLLSPPVIRISSASESFGA